MERMEEVHERCEEVLWEEVQLPPAASFFFS
uniref:Uncharacterized protein n=1 Tax=Nelumbo nucifera TaxID=4432 RepID=A0A822XGC8_NELNU|nr:TPA_asm: hypothetical protein HUJ06_019522 [Nelumbo nucifera]